MYYNISLPYFFVMTACLQVQDTGNILSVGHLKLQGDDKFTV